MKKYIRIIFSLCLFIQTGVLFPNHSSEEKPYVTCSLLKGQLGNQLYRIATTLAYAWDNGFEPIFPELATETDANIPLNRSRIFFRLNASPLPRPIAYTFSYIINFEKKDIPIKPDMNLYGTFQTWEYFDHHRDRIIDIFAPSAEELERIKSKYAEILNHPLTVGVHVRTFNKQVSVGIPFVGLVYYEKAMSYFPPNTLFVVFSDRINWCKHHFKKYNKSIIFVQGQDHIEEFFLMSMLKHNIIGNSSFSWWAAYLNRNSNKIVIAPSHFICPGKSKVTHANRPDWIVIDTNADHSIVRYPKDMYDYDTYSTSLDTQEKSYYILDAPEGDDGLFSCFHTVIGFLDFYEKNKNNCAGIKINFDKGEYLDPAIGPNWWEYFFEPIEIGDQKNANLIHCSCKQKNQWARNAISKINRDKASQLITKYIHIKPHILKKVDDFVATNFKKDPVIGVHYWGTDKNIAEATCVPYVKVYKEIIKVVKKQKYKRYKVFFATNKQAFITYMVTKFKNAVYYDTHRSTNGNSVHEQFKHNCFVGEEALINCLLLAHCDIIVGTFSNLHSAAANVNPHIPIITLNKSLIPILGLR